MPFHICFETSLSLLSSPLYSLWRQLLIQSSPTKYSTSNSFLLYILYDHCLSAGRFYITGRCLTVGWNTTSSILYYILSMNFLFSQLLPLLHIFSIPSVIENEDAPSGTSPLCCHAVIQAHAAFAGHQLWSISSGLLHFLILLKTIKSPSNERK